VKPISARVLAGAAGVTALAAGLVFSTVDLTPASESRADNPFLGKGEYAPREFAYLDNARIEAYLSQLHGGNHALRKISETATGKAGAEFTAGPINVGGEVTRGNTMEETVTPTTASNFLTLVQRLDEFKELVKLPEPDASGVDDVTNPKAGAGATRDNRLFADAWADVREGDIVRLRAEIRRPTFVRLYETLRQAPPTSRLGRRGARLLRAIGEQPRLPLAVEVEVPGAKGKPASTLRLVMPVQSANLTTEPSLFAPRLTVIGKVVRRVEPGKSYRDLNFYSRFEPVLRFTPAWVRGRLKTRIKRLHDELMAYRTLQAPSAVILPIAIYL
jgi:hypothetical protein